MKTQLFIPERIKVGFQKRDDTYSGSLAYVIYWDKKGVLRKETSWQSWRDQKIKPLEFSNEPRDGFVLNKGVGGAHGSHGLDIRNEYIRVFDPRDFEFEISVANLLYILRECDCSRGKGLDGKFVYAWDKTELVLLPISATEFTACQSFTSLQDKRIGTKELHPGATYLTKKQERLLYLGRFDYWTIVDGDDSISRQECRRAHIFYDGRGFVPLSSKTRPAMRETMTEQPDFAERVTEYEKSIHGSKIIALFTKTAKRGEGHSFHFATPLNNGFLLCEAHRWNDNSVYQYGLARMGESGYLFHSDYHYIFKNAHCRNWIEPTELELLAQLESGAEVKITSRHLY